MAYLLKSVVLLSWLSLSIADINEFYRNQPEWQTKLLSDLLTGYHRGVPPTHEGPINVYLSFSMTYFEIVDEAKALASVHGWSFQSWTDPRLRWDPESYNGTTNMILEIDDIWVPDIELYNGVSVTETTDTKAIVWNNGEVSRVPAYIITFTCDMNLRFFPYDTQVCSLKFGSWHHHADTINLTASELADISSYRESADFQLKNMTAERHATKYGCCKEPYIDVTYSITVRRKTGAYAAKLVMPSVLTGFLVLATFLLPTASYEKITLCSILFLCLLLLLTYLHDIIPNSGDTIIGEYLAFVLFIDFIATIIAVVAYRFNIGLSPMQKEPGIVENIQMEGDDNDLRMQMPKSRKKEWIRYLDIGCFILFSIVFVIGLAILLGRRG